MFMMGPSLLTYSSHWDGGKGFYPMRGPLGLMSSLLMGQRKGFLIQKGPLILTIDPHWYGEKWFLVHRGTV